MLCKTLLLLVVIHMTIGAAIEEAPVDYSQHKIIRILPKNWENLRNLNHIKTEFNERVDFWNPPMPDMSPVLSLVGPDGNDFMKALNNSNIKYEIAANNWQKVIDAEREESQRNSMYSTKAFDYDNVYHNYDEIVAELKSIASQNNKATYKSIGKTYQGRDIPALVITNSGGSSKKTVFFECGIHAREWVSTASCLWMSNQLLTNTAYDNYLSKYEFIVVPALNTDGYVYTWTNNRNWRKTRSPNGMCYGADPNRNWDTHFGETGASTNPCSETYCGKSAFSEVEVKQMADLIKSKSNNIAAYFAIHSYSQIWMYPWGYTKTLPPNNAELESLSKAAVDAIKATHGLSFTRGSIANAIYLASGSSIDWAYDNCGAKVAFALELRDKGQYGFQLPANQIKPACEETWAGVRAVLDRL